MSSKTGRGWCLKNSKIFAKSRIDWGTSGKWKSGHKCDETYHWHEKPKKTAENMNTPPPLPTLKMLKKLFSPKKPRNGGNIPKCDGTHRWRQKPEKKSKK